MPMNSDFMSLGSFIDQVDLFGESDGFDGTGLDSEGYDRDGFKEDEYGVMRDRDGYDEDGYREDIHGTERDRDGYDRDGYDGDGFNSNGYDSDGYDEDGRDSYGDSRHENGDCEEYCGECEDERERGNMDTSWFNGDPPRWIFHSTQAEKDEAEREGRYTPGKRLTSLPYFGMEIELTSDCNSTVRDLIIDEYGSIVRAKADCSVEGFEMVTHPMTLRWAQENFPWRIVDQLEAAGCEVWPEYNGLHIHVSRSGFNGWAHQYRWVKMFYSIKDQIKGRDGMAGRNAGEWGAFSDSGQRDQYKYFRWQMARKNGADYQREVYMPRYQALNLQNSGTIEARVFSSTTDSKTLRMRFELMAATVEYTRNQTIQDIRNGGWEYETFARWLFKNEGTYPVLEQRVGMPALSLA